MRKIEIPEDIFRDMATRFSFVQIAKMYHCDPRVIGHIARLYGVRSSFVPKPETKEEAARILALSAEGLTIQAIAKVMERSQDFVASRLRGDPSRAMGAPSRKMWKPEISEAIAMRGVKFEDAPVKSSGRPVDGKRLASWARRESLMGCSGAMCEDFA